MITKQTLDIDCHYLRSETTFRLSDLPLVITEHKTGWFLRVPTDSDGEQTYPEDLRGVLRVAREHHCQLVHLHMEGGQCPGLELFDW
jgi:hypothetical protein